jgi:Domain of unknown function (DUF4290)
MEYNTDRTELVIPEYGRIIHSLIERCKNLATKELRNEMAEGIIEFMRQRNPLLRDQKNTQNKLWDHLFIMANYQLDVDSPYPIITAEELKQKPERLPYPALDYEYKFYGKSIRTLIDIAIAMPQGDEKNALISKIANNMKKSYNVYNKEHVQDDVIFRHLAELSKHEINVTEIDSLEKNRLYETTTKGKYTQNNQKFGQNNKQSKFSNKAKHNYKNHRSS